MNIITIKNLKVSPSLSEETTAFTAEVYLDGKHICHAKNSGRGGSNIYYPAEGKTHADIEVLQAIAKTKTQDDYEPLDEVLNDLIEEATIVKKYQSKCLVFRKGDNFSRISPYKDSPAILPLLKDLSEKKYIIGIINNKTKEGYVLLNTNLSCLKL